MSETTELNGTGPRLEMLANHDSKSWVVHKYGGTSVGKFPEQIAGIIREGLARHRVVVVCSARSSNTKIEGTTNRLLRAAKEAENLSSRGYEAIVQSIRDDHIAAAKHHIKSPQVLASLCAEIEDECQDLVNFLIAAQRVREISTRSLDTVISKGEILSCRFMAAVLQDSGVDAKLVDLSDIIGANSDAAALKGAEPIGADFYQRLAVSMKSRLQDCGSRVPVVTGYFGSVPGGLISQVGRGYTDLCAALCAVGLLASELQIWKEVDGIFTADPRKVPTARLLPSISPAEASELTFYGSEVIHPFTMDQVMRQGIPVRILNVMRPKGAGTKIVPEPTPVLSRNNSNGSLVFRPASSEGFAPLMRRKRPTAVTIKRNILILNIRSNKRSLSHGFISEIFSALDRWRLSSDVISTSQVHVSVALHSDNAWVSGHDENKRVVDADLEGALEELKQVGDVILMEGMAILSLVGKEMKNMIGVAGRMFTVLGDNNINIEMISQGASEINITCVIAGRDADRAMSVLHTNLFTFLDDASA